MSPRRGSRKTENSRSEKRNREGLNHESNEESDESDGYETPHLVGSLPRSEFEGAEDETAVKTNEKCCSWWLGLSKKMQEERMNCIKIHLLSPFLLGVVPPGQEDKVIDWSYECGLLPSKDIQQVFSPTDQTFESIRIVENAFGSLADKCNSKEEIINFLNLKDEFIKLSSVETAIKHAEKFDWFKTLRSHVKLMTDSRKEMGDMSLLLAIYHFAGHVQMSVSDDTDVLKRYKQDCKLAEEKALELKEQGNTEFLSTNFRAAISLYSRAVGLSPFNHIVYGNRAQSYLKLENYRQALIDAKRTVVLKPEWDKGQYRFKQAVRALRKREGEKATFLSFFVDRRFLSNEYPGKENPALLTKDKNSERSKRKSVLYGFDEDDTDGDSLPDLVSADDSDTSVEEDGVKMGKEPEMPELIGDEDSDKSSLDEDDSELSSSAEKKKIGLFPPRSEKKPKKREIVAKIREEQRAIQEEKAKEKARRDAERKQGKPKKSKKTRESNEVETLIPLSWRKTQVEDILRQGSKALLKNLYHPASESYSKALGIIQTGSRQSLDFGDQKYVIVLYAYGTAMLGMGVQKELESAKSTFENIISSFKTVDFPLAYYGLGRVYHRQNRFQEAIKSLEEGLHVIQDRTFDSIYWPGTDDVIEETLNKNMKVAFERILKICKYPPKPDAICRFDKCRELKKSIYGSDPDYKGYVRIVCTESCLIEYHVHCWKRLKSEYAEKSSDKDFLDSNCFTVDCSGHVVAIQVHDEEGLKTEVNSEKNKGKKDLKSGKKVTAETTSGSKKKKRSKKKEGNYSNDENHGLNPSNKPHASDEKTVIQEKEEKENKAEDKSVSTNLKDVSKIPDTGMFVLKKTDDQDISQLSKQGKGKNKKKKTKKVQSLDEFLGRDNEHVRHRPMYLNDEDYDEIPSEPFFRKPPPDWMSNPFTIPAHLHNDAQEIESSLSTYSSSRDNMYRSNDPWKADSIREFIYSSFIQLLKVEGSLHVDSNLMTTHLSIMPEEARKLVEEEGGLREFLSQSSLFAVESDIVTNLEEKLFTDLSKSYKKSQEASFNAVTEKKNGSTSVEDLGPLLKRSDSAEYQPESMNSLSNIEEDSHADSRLKTSIYATKSPDLNYRSKTGRLNLSSNNDVSNEEHSSQETGEVINWDEEMSDQIELELQQEYALQEPRNAEDKKENVDKTLNNGSSHSLPNLVESSFLPTKANLSQLNDAVNGFEKSFNDEKTLRTENTYTSGDSTDIVSLTMSDKDVAANREKNDLYKKITKNEQNERAKRHDIYPSSKRTMTEGSAVVVDTKSTKEKGIQAQATVKHKAVTTESMTEPYKMEYEKLLQESESWNIRHQEALDKNVQLQKKYNLELLNLNKKLEEVSKQKQVIEKRCEEMASRHQQEIKTFQLEKREKSEQIKKLHDQISAKSESEERRVQSLESEISALQTCLEKEKELQVTEKENVEKLKAFSQQQAQRACTAEVQLLELQRDVSFSFYTRAIQEAEVTLHNVSQILALSPSPQFLEIRQKWQLYVTECKQQMNHNKAQFETFIPQLKEGKPLASLKSLRIVRPGPYPCPPILHLPPGGVLPGSKPVPAPPPVVVRPETTCAASPAVTSVPAASTSKVVPPVVRPESLRPQVPHPVSTNQPATASRTEKAAGVAPGHNLRKASEQTLKVSNSFEKIMLRLSTLFPNYSRTQMTNFIKEVRASKNGSLTGLSFDDIVACVTQLVKARETQASQNAAAALPSKPQQPASMSDVPRPTGTLTKSTKRDRSSSLGATPVGQMSSEILYEEDPCVICHDEMTNATRNVSLDCGHKFHHDCIKKWLIGEQSTCPTCRVHALLPEDFPQLK